MHIANAIEGHNTMINFAKNRYNQNEMQSTYFQKRLFEDLDHSGWICNGYNTESCQKAYNNDNNAHSIKFYW